MINEIVDKDSGAILFKKDKESISLEEVVRRNKDLEKLVNKLEKRIKKLEETQIKDSN